MKNIILCDPTTCRDNLLPLTFTRTVAEIRVGIDTISQKWQRSFPGNYSQLTVDYLSEKFPAVISADNYFINGNILPNDELINALNALNPGEGISDGKDIIAYRAATPTDNITATATLQNAPTAINQLYDIFMLNYAVLANDFNALTAGRKSQPIDSSCHVIGDSSLVFIEEGAKVIGSYLNTTAGPIYIGKDAEVMEGSCLRGPLAMCEHSVINMGSKIYGGTTLGPYCKVGGEINNVVMIGYSNKAHDGFLGNAVIGEWCNLGAGCVASNLKNDYSEIRLWNYPTQRFLRTGLQFCGLIMGDHSKAAINTMFNTATVVGVGVNFYGAGFVRTFIPSFNEGSVAGFNRVPLKKFFDIASRVMVRRHKELTDVDRRLFEYLYANS